MKRIESRVFYFNRNWRREIELSEHCVVWEGLNMMMAKKKKS